MLPDMTTLLQKFPFMFPDTVTVQQLGEATMSDSGAVIPGGWEDVTGLTGLKCLIESTTLSRTGGGEKLSEQGSTVENRYDIAFDRLHVEIINLHRLVDQDGKTYEIHQVTRDNFHATTIIKAKEYLG